MRRGNPRLIAVLIHLSVEKRRSNNIGHRGSIKTLKLCAGSEGYQYVVSDKLPQTSLEDLMGQWSTRLTCSSAHLLSLAKKYFRPGDMVRCDASSLLPFSALNNFSIGVWGVASKNTSLVPQCTSGRLSPAYLKYCVRHDQGRASCILGGSTGNNCKSPPTFSTEDQMRGTCAAFKGVCAKCTPTSTALFKYA